MSLAGVRVPTKTTSSPSPALRTSVAVETGGEWCRGQTVVDHYEITGVDEYEPNDEVVEEASRGRFLHMLYQAVRT
jgi:inosine-uridine nucleoside N-ribohydrolase